MPCYRPLSAWRNPGALKLGESRIVFAKHDQAAKPLILPCGKCVGCRLEKSRRWAVRLMHESQLHPASSFLTLTYSDEFLPKDLSLDVRHFQLFMKRLRKSLGVPIRFFHCGEYGEKHGRPHYHVCLFGEDFASDRVFIRQTPQGDNLFASPRLYEAWGMGDFECQLIGDLTFESAAYVARYCLKKLSVSERSPDHIVREHRDRYFDEASQSWRRPEYVTMSRRPGIGADWFAKYSRETYSSDSVVMRGIEMMPPPFYDKLLEKVDPALFSRIKRQREKDAGDFYDNPDNHSRRLIDREIVKRETVKSALKRT